MNNKLIPIFLISIILIGLTFTFYPKIIGWATQQIGSIKIQEGNATSYVYAGSNLLMSKDAEGKKYYVKDHLGSTSVVLDDNAEVVEEHSYLAFGEPKNSGKEKYLYTGKELDDTGLYDGAEV